VEPIPLSEIVRATNAKLISGKASGAVTSICIDSRKLKKGSLFVPLKGEKTNGHAFIKEAFLSGAIASLTEQKKPLADQTLILVENTEQALQDIATHYRKKFDLPVVAITGSVGKTTAKDIISSILSAKLNVMKTRGNFNSQIGLPLCLTHIDKKSQVAVLELGISKPGEMQNLVKIASPNISVVTNIGLSHVEYLKNKTTICKEKLHIKDTLGENDTLILNGDDPTLRGAKIAHKKIVYFGFDDKNDLVAKDLSIRQEGISFTFKGHGFSEPMKIKVPSKCSLYAVLAGIEIALNLRFSMREIKKGLELYEGTPMRQQIRRTKEGVTLIDDTYNSSPDSVKSALEILEQMPSGGKKIVVLADMMELGEFSKKEHYKLGGVLSKSNVDLLFTVGKEAKNIALGLKDSKPSATALSFFDKERMTFELCKILSKNDIVLIKGSRGMQMEQVVEKILASHQ
jgi:UDP-N-acetylmuramoyl-tripeptide--D-alanyl-D-alanine ligase